MSDTTDLLDAPANGQRRETPPADSSATKPARKRSAGLSGMVLAELQGLAGELGISGTAKMRKGQLIEAIKERQAGGPAARPPSTRRAQPPRRPRPAPAPARPPTTTAGRTGRPDRRQPPCRRPSPTARRSAAPRPVRATATGDGRASRRPARPAGRPAAGIATAQQDDRQGNQGGGRERDDRGGQQGNRQQGDQAQGGQAPGQPGQRPGQPERRGRLRRRRRPQPSSRPLPRPQPQPPRRPGRLRPERRRRSLPEISEDDVLVPVAGILDIHGQLRVRPDLGLPARPERRLRRRSPRSARAGLRKGDAVTGAVRAAAGGRAQGEVQRARPPRHASTAPTRTRPGTGSSSAS